MPWQAATLGAVQGLAEVYPVSSSAQVTLLPWLLGWPPPADRTRFAAGLHLGSTIGLAVALRDDVRTLRPAEVRRVLLSAAPAAVTGLLLHDVVERRLGRPGPTAALLALSAAALWLVDRQAESPQPSTAPLSPAGLVGGSALDAPTRPAQRGMAAASLAQVTALAPGVSRTSATLTAFRAGGVGRDEALRTSLLMSLPVTLGAAALTAVRGRAVPPLVPTLVAGVTAHAAARRVRATERFVGGSVLYRLAVATAVAVRLRRERP